MKVRVISFVLLVLWASAAMSKRDSHPFIPLPDDVRLIVVGEQLKVYGLPLMAYEYFHQESVEDIANFYRAAWSDSAEYADVDEPVMEMALGKWLVLSRLESGHNITVQLSDSGVRGTHVLIGVSPLPTLLESGNQNKVDINIPLLGDVRVVSLVASEDDGDQSEVYWLETAENVSNILERYRKHFVASGQEVTGYRLMESERVNATSGILTINIEEKFLRMQAMAGEDGMTRIVAIRQQR